MICHSLISGDMDISKMRLGTSLKQCIMVVLSIKSIVIKRGLKKTIVNNEFCSLFTQITLPWPTPPPTKNFAFSHECLQVLVLRYSSASLCTLTEVRYYLQNSHQELSHVYMVLDFYLWRGLFSDIQELSLCYCLVSCVVMLLAELKTINSIWRELVRKTTWPCNN